MKSVILLFIFLVISQIALGQKRTIEATRIFKSPDIDGILDDSCWQHVPEATDFLTNEPVFGKIPEQQTVVKLVYNNAALYVGAYLYDSEPSLINTSLCERDKNVIGDEFIVGLDTYNDKTTAFRFQVTAAGVQTERYMSPFIPPSDKSWDAVWESAVSVNDDGWVVEMRIPLTALRFPNVPQQEWGIQFGRFVGRTGVFTTWSPVNPNIRGAIHQWGLLTNLLELSPAPRLSLFPYFSLGVQRTPTSIINRQYANQTFYSGGLDLKYGLDQSFTVDMTMIPDFSQVQSDNTVLNLSPFEVKYDERRQFFTEGIDMFNKAGIFYSRRIGAVPSGFSSVGKNLGQNEHIEDNPSVTRLYNATKFSGRTNSGLGIGVLNAVTAPRYAVIKNDSTGLTRELLTEPLTNYNIFVLDQSLANNSKVGVINTNVLRNGGSIDANMSALDVLLNTEGNVYSMSGTAIYSYREGSGVKQNGYNYKLNVAKVSGNVRLELFNSAISKEYNANDLGISAETNRMQNFLAFRYFDFVPVWEFLNWNLSLSYTATHTLNSRTFQQSAFDVNAFFLFRDFSDLTLKATIQPSRTNDIYEPRTDGRVFVRPTTNRFGVLFNSDTRKRFQWKAGATLQTYEFPDEHVYHDILLGSKLNISDKIALSFSTFYSGAKNNLGYVTTETSGAIIFGKRNETIVENIFSLQYLFSATSNISFRVRDYWSKITYDSFTSLNEDGSLAPSSHVTNHDLNSNIFNIDMIYTWQFAAGSFFVLSWKNSISQTDDKKDDGYFHNLTKTLDAPQTNIVSLKLIYFIDYGGLKSLLGME
jgi:hypothetical protein